jgi:hypothetical protein
MSSKSKKSSDSSGDGPKRNWGSQSDVDVGGDSFRVAFRDAKITCAGLSPSVAWMFEPMHENWFRKTVPDNLVAVAGMGVVEALLFTSKVTEIQREQDFARKWNKRIRDDVDAGIVVFMKMFESTSSVSEIMASAVSKRVTARGKWFGLLAALQENFAPKGAAQAMKFKQQVKDLKDTGKKFSEYFITLKKLTDTLGDMDQAIPPLEMEAIVMANVLNPDFKSKMTDLTLEMGQTEGRTYDYLQFLGDCRKLAAARQEVDDWGLDKDADGAPIKKAMSAAKAEGAAVGGKNTGGGKRELVCWKCGGKHFKVDCKASSCENCKTSLSRSVDHDAQKCTGGKSKESRKGDSSKGGGGKDSKGKSGSSAKKGWSKDYEEKKNKDTFLPLPKSIPNSVKRSYAVAIMNSFKDDGSEEEAPAKKKSKKAKTGWEAEESD